MPGAAITSPKSGRELVAEYFIENRTRVLEIASFLDRLDRLDRAGDDAARRDFRMRAFTEALAVLSGDSGSRVEQIQMIFSDPTAEPLEVLDQKSARGAYDRWSQEVA